jgi:hypothetical protein
MDTTPLRNKNWPQQETPVTPKQVAGVSLGESGKQPPHYYRKIVFFVMVILPAYIRWKQMLPAQLLACNMIW